MIRKNKHRFSGIYVKFFMANAILTFIAILIVGFLSYSISYSALTGQISSEKVNTLTQARNTADVTLKEIEKTFIAESINTQLLKFTEDPSAEEYELLKQTVKKLVSIKNSNKLIFSIYICLPGHNLVVTTEDGFWKMEEFYDLAWRDSMAGESGGNWTTTRNIRTFAGEHLGVASYITPIPFDEHADGRSNLLVVNIKEKELLKLVQDHGTPSSGLSCITDAAGRVVAHTDKELLGKTLPYAGHVVSQILNGKSGSVNIQHSQENYVASHVRSEYNKWNYIRVTPEKQIIKPILYLRLMSVIFAVACIILGLVAAYFVSARIYRPISETVSSTRKYMAEIESLPGDKDGGDEMGFLNAAIKHIVEKNHKLSKTVQKTETLLKEGFILDLLMSSAIDEIQLENKLRQLHIDFPHPDFFILVIAIDKFNGFVRDYCEKDRALYAFGIKNIAEEIVNGNSYGIVVQTDRDKFAIVLNCREEQISAGSVADAVRENIRSIFRFTVTVGVSTRFSTPNEIGYMYNEALEFAKSRILLGGDRTIGRAEVPLRRDHEQPVSSSREEALFNHIKQGNIGEAMKQIEKTVNALRKEPGYPPEQIHQFFYSVLYTSIKAVNDNGWTLSDIFGNGCNLYRDLVENDTIMDMQQWMGEILTKMSHFIVERKESRNFTLIEAILKYMHANYHKDISLNFMADYVSLSTPYLSKLFKSETGENFLEYLTRLRIEKSKELLLDPDHKITSIAEKVNFGNAQNYIRIFKKYEGMTPGQYREMYIKEKLNNQE